MSPRVWPSLEGLCVVALGLGTLLILFAQSEALSLSVDELGHVQGIERVGQLWDRVLQAGLGALGSDFASRAFRGLGDVPQFFVMINATVVKLLQSLGFSPGLTSHRFGQLLFNALTPLAIYTWLRPTLAKKWAFVCALMPLLVPRWLHAAVILDGACILGTSWLLVLAADAQCVAARRAPARLLWAAGAAVALGLGLAVSWFAVFIVPIVAWNAHRSRPRYAAGHAQLVVPTSVAACVLLGPLVLLAVSPRLWLDGPLALAMDWLDALDRQAPEQLFHGHSVQPAAVFQLDWLMATTPVALLLLAALGVLLARPHASAAWWQATLALAFVLVWPWFGPAEFDAFAPRPGLLLPFVAALAGFGLRAVCARSGATRALWLATLLPLSLLAGLGMPTSGVSFSWLVGGPAGVWETERYRLLDGSELQPLMDELPAGSSAYVEHLPAKWLVYMSQLERAELKRANEATRADIVVKRFPQAAAQGIQRGRLLLWGVERGLESM